MSEPLQGKILPCLSYTSVGDDMTWPSYDQGELEWRLRYGREDNVIDERMKVASIVSAYRALMDLPQKRRNAIIEALKKAKP